MKQTVEVWRSDQNQEEIHHFVADERNTYLFGFNRQLLGDKLYKKVKKMVDAKAEKLDPVKVITKSLRKWKPRVCSK